MATWRPGKPHRVQGQAGPFVGCPPRSRSAAQMDGRSRQDPAYRRATARALFGGPSLRSAPAMRFSLYYPLQLPQPWAPGSEQRLVQEALEQIALADRLGFDTAWAAEHHFLE